MLKSFILFLTTEIKKKFTNISKRIKRLGIRYENQAGRKGRKFIGEKGVEGGRNLGLCIDLINTNTKS